jgi:hypothetical protein
MLDTLRELAMHWSDEALYNKSKYYMQIAARESSLSELFPLWSALSLELLCRAALAKVDPVLLADPRDVDNLLYAAGHPIGKSPKSRATSEVIQLCVRFVPRFDTSKAGRAQKMFEVRNAELHSGEAAFATLSTGTWQPDHYALVEVLLGFLGRTMEDYLGTELAARAKQMLNARTEETRKAVSQRIARCRHWAEQLPADDLEEKRKAAESRISNLNRDQFETDSFGRQLG